MRVGFREQERQRCGPTSTEPTLGLICIEWEGVARYWLIRPWRQSSSSSMCFLAAPTLFSHQYWRTADLLPPPSFNVKVAGHPSADCHFQNKVWFLFGWPWIAYLIWLDIIYVNISHHKLAHVLKMYSHLHFICENSSYMILVLKDWFVISTYSSLLILHSG